MLAVLTICAARWKARSLQAHQIAELVLKGFTRFSLAARSLPVRF